MKECTKCRETKPLTEFYRDKTRDDGYNYTCKACRSKLIRRLRGADPERFKQYYDRYAQTARGKHFAALRSRRWREKNGWSPNNNAEAARRWELAHPKEYRAQRLLQHAVRMGRIKKQPCERCGSTKRIHGHHHDYSRPYDVRWLCNKHHRELHRRYQGGQEPPPLESVKRRAKR